MKKRDVSHWTKGPYFDGMLLLVQTLEECAFQYSYESYRAPALNCHFLCYDVIKTARDIERKILMDGNFVPLAEEFEQMLDEDLFVKSKISDRSTLLIGKDKNANYYDLSSCDLKSKIKLYPDVAIFVRDACEVGDNYYLKSLIEAVIENIFVDTFSFKNSDCIYKTARMIVTEFINNGYSKEYVYRTVNDFFYNPNHPINCDKETVEMFFKLFSFDAVTYRTTFGVNRKVANTLAILENIRVRRASYEERRQLNLQGDTDCVAELEVEAVDPFSAYEEGRRIIDTIQSLHIINQHNIALFVTNKALISQKTADEEFETSILLQNPQNPMKRKGNTPVLHALYNDIMLFNKIEPPQSFYRAISLHHGALESKDISNQLLNLWTILEILIDTKRDDEDRINTICTTMCSILNRRYLYSNLEQLLHDIEVCCECEFEELVQGVELKDRDIDSVEKLALVLSLEEMSASLSNLREALSEYPLLKYRVDYFSNCVLVDSKSIYEYLKRHEKRIRWHIMRIYRNRNMIVHNGSYMPYRTTIVENLHFYVDVLLDTLIEYYHFGMMNHLSVYKNITDGEMIHYLNLGVSLVGKKKQSSIQLTAENALNLIFNGYSGNQAKKELDRIVNQNTPTDNANECAPQSLPASK